MRTAADMETGKAWDDAIGINTLIPDLYSLSKSLSFDTLPHGISYRCLASKKIDTLMPADSTIAFRSLPMTGLGYVPSIIQWQASGIAAAIMELADMAPKNEIY